MSKVVIRNEGGAGAVEEEERSQRALRQKRSGSLEHMCRGWWRGVLESTLLQRKMHWTRFLCTRNVGFAATERLRRGDAMQ